MLGKLVVLLFPSFILCSIGLLIIALVNASFKLAFLAILLMIVAKVIGKIAVNLVENKEA